MTLIGALQSHALLNFLHRNYKKNKASVNSAWPICTVKASVDSLFSELSTIICFMSVPLARADIFLIYWRPLEIWNRYFRKGAYLILNSDAISSSAPQDTIIHPSAAAAPPGLAA